jgi:hypothetical protein
VWAVSATTKLDIAEGANAQGQQNVLVLHVVNFHRQQLELGAHASRQLMRRVTDHVKRALGSSAIVSVQHNGTIVALLPGDREAAERRAHELVEHFETTPISLNGHGATAFVTLACGVIAFQQAGPPVARSIPIALPAAEPAAALTS